MAELNDKQRRFVDAYLIDLNGTQAAISAGYSSASAEVTASRLLRNAKVAKAIAAEQAKRAERVHVDQDYVLSSIVDTMERCKQASPVLDRRGEQVMTETPDGKKAAAYAFQPAAVLKGAELLMRHLGMGEGPASDGEQVAGALREIADKLPG